jgi:hypothetical protein
MTCSHASHAHDAYRAHSSRPILPRGARLTLECIASRITRTMSAIASSAALLARPASMRRSSSRRSSVGVRASAEKKSYFDLKGVCPTVLRVLEQGCWLRGWRDGGGLKPAAGEGSRPGARVRDPASQRSARAHRPPVLPSPGAHTRRECTPAAGWLTRSLGGGAPGALL